MKLIEPTRIRLGSREIVHNFACYDCGQPAVEAFYARSWEGDRASNDMLEPIYVKAETVLARYACAAHADSVSGRLCYENGASSNIAPWEDEPWRWGR